MWIMWSQRATSEHRRHSVLKEDLPRTIMSLMMRKMWGLLHHHCQRKLHLDCPRRILSVTWIRWVQRDSIRCTCHQEGAVGHNNFWGLWVEWRRGVLSSWENGFRRLGNFWEYSHVNFVKKSYLPRNLLFIHRWKFWVVIYRLLCTYRTFFRNPSAQ